MSTISELNRTTELKLDQAREKLKDLNERIFGNEKNREFLSNQRRRPTEMKRTMSSNSNSSIKNRIKIDYKNDDDNSEHPKIMSRVVSNSKDSIRKREQVIAMQSSRKNDIDRNKRMFGDLIGHIQKFKREENILKDKEDKKAQIEQKIEEQAALDKIKMKQEREALIANRRRKQMEIRSLELKVEKLNDLQMWEENQKRSLNYIKTSIKPALFWLPKVMDVKTTALQKKTSQDINDKIEERRKQVDEEIKNIENSLEKDDSMDENFDDKKHTSHNDVSYENGKQDETDRGSKRRQSYSPDIVIRKRVCSQVIVKSRD